MMPTIRIEDDVFQALKSLAEPFVDTPNTVIRRLLRDRTRSPKETTIPKVTNSPNRLSGARANANIIRDGELTHQKTYEEFLLHVLATKFNGKAHKHEVTKAVLELMTEKGLIGPAELVTVSTGETRAANTIAWGRNALKEKGLISHISDRGVWELTTDGMSKAQSLKLQ